MRATPSCERSPAGVHLFHPGQVRTGEHVATLDPPRAYWAGCAVCGADLEAWRREQAQSRLPSVRVPSSVRVTVDLAAPARERTGPGPDGASAPRVAP